MLYRRPLTQRDMIGFDGRRDNAVLFTLAHARAKAAILDGTPLTYAQEFRHALRVLTDVQSALWSSHPANAARVRYTVIDFIPGE